MRTALAKLCPILIFIMCYKSFSAPITIWVPPYAIEKCKATVQKDFGGIGFKDVVEYLPLQFWVPNGPNISRVSYTSEDDVKWFRDWGKSNGVKVLLCIYNHGDNGWDWNMATNSFINNRDAFVNSIVSEVQRLDLDGVDLDLEGPGDYNYDKDAYMVFANQISERLHAIGKEVTIATFANQYNAPNWDWWPELSPIMDGIATMGYDWSGLSNSYQDQVNHADRWNRFMIGMPGWLGDWQGNNVYEQLDWVINHGTIGMAIWDAQLESDAWHDPVVWQKLLAISQSGNGPISISTTAENGNITLSPDQDEYEKGTEVTITAKANEGYVFVGWSGNYGTNNSITITVNSNISLSAYFASKGELISNGDFSNNDEFWAFNTYNNGEGTGSVINESYSVNVIKGQEDSWSLRLKQNNLPLVKDSGYTLSFTAWAEQPRELEYKIGKATDSWDRYNGNDSIASLTTAPKTFNIYFIMNHGTDMNARVEFNGGTVGANWFIDDVSLKMGKHDLTEMNFSSFLKPKSNLISNLKFTSNNIQFNSAEKLNASITIYNHSGKTLFKSKRDFKKVRTF